MGLFNRIQKITNRKESSSRPAILSSTYNKVNRRFISSSDASAYIAKNMHRFYITSSKFSKGVQVKNLLRKLDITIPRDGFIYFLDEFKNLDYDGVVLNDITIDYSYILNNSIYDLNELYFNPKEGPGFKNVSSQFNREMLAVLDGMELLIYEIHKKLRRSSRRDKAKYIRFFEDMIDQNATHFEEALQRILFYNQLLYQTGHSLNGFGRLDRVLEDLYFDDLNNGIITAEEAYGLIKDFLRAASSYSWFKTDDASNINTQIIVLGGKYADEYGEYYFYNDLTYMFIQAISELKLKNIKIAFRVGSQTPSDLLELALRSLPEAVNIGRESVTLDSGIKSVNTGENTDNNENKFISDNGVKSKDLKNEENKENHEYDISIEKTGFTVSNSSAENNEFDESTESRGSIETRKMLESIESLESKKSMDLSRSVDDESQGSIESNQNKGVADSIENNARTGPNIIFFNDEIIIKKMIDFGYAESDAYNYVVSSHLEPAVLNCGIEQNHMLSLSLLKPLMDIFDNQSKDFISSIRDFEDLMDHYKYNLKGEMESVCQKIDDTKFNSDIFLSLFVEDCYDNQLSVGEGGARYGHCGIHTYGLVDAVNSLYNLKKFVFTDKSVDLLELNKMRKNNFKKKKYHETYMLLKNSQVGFGKDNNEIIKISNEIISYIDFCLREHFTDLNRKIKFGLSAPEYMVEDYKKASFDGSLKEDSLSAHLISNRAKKISPLDTVKFISKLDFTESGLNGNSVELDVRLEDYDSLVYLLEELIEIGFFQLEINLVH